MQGDRAVSENLGKLARCRHKKRQLYCFSHFKTSPRLSITWNFQSGLISKISKIKTT
jgi:hypothetical protein